MQELTEILLQATELIEARYFRLPISGGSPVYRERVYCYELYHRMRSLWPNDSEYTINGEVDKRAHPILRRLHADHTIPDFLIHTPGNMAGNHAIIEVKHNLSPHDVKIDLSKIQMFLRDVGYRRGIYLFFGRDDQEIISSVNLNAAELDITAPIEIWHHAEVGRPARQIYQVG